MGNPLDGAIIHQLNVDAGSIRLRVLEQNVGADFQPFRDPLNIIDRDITFATLHTAIICAAHLDLERKILLTDAAFQTAPADVCRQYVPEQTRMRAFHGS